MSNSEIDAPAEESRIKDKKNILERVPLRHDIPPITRELVDAAEDDEECKSLEEEGIIWVDFEGGDLTALEEKGFKLAGPHSFLISPSRENNWCSDHYFNCTGVVAIGRSKKTGKEISFLSHQDPRYFIDGNYEESQIFKQALQDSLEELKHECEEGTIEVSLVGGNFNSTATAADYRHEHYRQSIEILREIVQESMGFDPTVLTGPNNRIGSGTDIVVKTQNRKVSILRNEQPSAFDLPYQANEFDTVAKTW